MDLIGKNGKIDGILAAQVLLDGGVFFFKPGELYYDGTYHQVKGMQANTTAMRDFPGIFDKMDTLAPELVNLMVYIEKNTMFRVKLEDLGEEIREFLQNEDMTGMTFLYLFKWHLLALNRNVDGITVSMETRVETAVSDSGAMDPVAEPMQTTAASPVAVAAATPAAALPAEFSSYADDVKPKLQKVADGWTQYLEEFKKELSTVRFTGFSDPKIKEMRDKIADKQEDFGGDLEEI